MENKFFDNVWEVSQVRDGKEIWGIKKNNALTNVGQNSILNSYFLNENNPTNFYIRACSGYIGLADTLNTIKGEPDVTPYSAGIGYAPILIPRSAIGFPTIDIEDGNFRITSKQVSWTSTAVAAWSPINFLFLSTTSDNSGVLVCSLNLSTQRTLAPGDIINIQFKIKLA